MHRVYIDRTQLHDGGQPIVVEDEWGRIRRYGTEGYELPAGAHLRFNPDGKPGVDKTARVWVEYPGGAL